MKRLIFTLAVCGSASAQQVDPDRLVRPYWWDQPVVEGLGRALVEVPPNRADFSATFVETNKDAEKAMQDAVARAKIAYDAVRKVAGKAALARTSVLVEPYYEQYRDKDGERIENDRPDKVAGYEARASVSVTLKDVDLAGRARAAVLALGPEDSDAIRFRLEETIELQRAALKVAAEDARARAEATAVASGGRLGKLLVLQEGQGPCMGNWSTRQMARQIDEYVPSPSPPPAPMRAAAMEKVMVTGSLRGREIVVTEEDIEALNLPSDFTPEIIHSSICAVYLLEQ